jgi:putative NADH-flavin reductase
VSRGHQVISVSRSQPKDPVEGVRYETGGIEELALEVIPGADAVVAALAPRGDMAGRLVEVYGRLAQHSAEAGARYVQIGGFNTLRPAPAEPRFVDGEVAEEVREEALEVEATRVMLVDAAADDLDWVFVSPALGYGDWAVGERTGNYRVGDEVALFDCDGNSYVSGGDFALAVVDEIETPVHHRAHINVAY